MNEQMATPSNAPKHDLSALRINDAQRGRSNLGRRLALLVGGLVLLAGLSGAIFVFWGRSPEVEVAVAQKPSVGGREALLNASGYVTPRRRATIAAKITGLVTGVFFDEGSHVHERQVLATLDDSDARRALESAKGDRDSTKATVQDYEVQLRNAHITLGRTEQLQQAGIDTQEQLDTARTAVDSFQAKIDLVKAQVAAAEARIQEAQQAVDNCTIRAPFDGIVVSKDAQIGEMVSPISAGGGFTRTGIATIVDMNSNEIEVDVNEAYIARVVPGQAVTAVLDAYPDWQIPSRVRTVIPSADREKATVKVRISFLKLDPRILPDMGVKVTFLSEEQHHTKSGSEAPAGVLVPQSAVRDDAGRKIVFLVKDNHAERRAVTVGDAKGGDVEIIGGLTQGDIVIVKGPPDIRDGQSVQVRKQGE
jgi:RND family efflux transporter MFP subunit